jgi:hypothetical protein
MKQHRPLRAAQLLAWSVLAALTACGGGGGSPPAPEPVVIVDPLPTVPAPAVDGPAWWGFGRDAQHSAVSAIATQDLGRITWSTPVDQAPQYTRSGALLAHYGSPVVTTRNTVILPVKTGLDGGFRIEARSGGNGALMWSQPTDYVLPPHTWVPSYNLALTAAGRLYAPAGGGRLLVRDNPDSAGGALGTAVFYGASAYAADPAAFDASVFINTPVTSDAQGNVFFGFVVTGANPAGLASGIARIDAQGNGRWVSVSAAAGDPAIAKPATNNAPALSPDMGTLYVAVNTAFVQSGPRPTGYLLALDSATLAVKNRVRLMDPTTGLPAAVADTSTASPAVGPDGRVFFGVLESSFGEHNARGWLLQFDPSLAPVQQPGSFGWDVTPTLIPAAMAPTYTGTSSYLVAVKYNNYSGIGGDGVNRLAVLDPNAGQPDSFSSQAVMREVLTIIGPTFKSGSSGPVEEWCINTMAADPFTRSILVNSEDGILYRWHLPSNSFTQSIRITDGLGQAYTPTAVGADGAVYAIGNARLFSVGR